MPHPFPLLLLLFSFRPCLILQLVSQYLHVFENCLINLNAKWLGLSQQMGGCSLPWAKLETTKKNDMLDANTVVH